MNQQADVADVVQTIDITRISKKRKKDRIKKKGTQPDPKCIAALETLLTQENLKRRDLLIENLHVVHDHFGCLREQHLVALAHLSKLPMAEVYEVASFYHHFDIVKDEQDIWDLTVRVCDGVSCELAGAQSLFEKIGEFVSDNTRVIKAPCVGRCEQAPVAVVHQNPIPFAKPGHCSKRGKNGAKISSKNCSGDIESSRF